MEIRQKQTRFTLPNRIIWFLTFSDGFSWGAYYALASLIGLFLAHRLDAQVEQVVGIGLGIFMLFRAISQLLIGAIADKLPTYADEIVFMILGGLLMGTPFLFYPFLTFAWQYYLLQVSIGIGMSMNLIGWRKLFAKNLDKGKEGLDYGVYDSVYSLIGAGLSVTAGFIANINDLAFGIVVLTAGGMIMLSGLWAMLIAIELNKNSPK
jgi:MFS family permease